MRSNARLASVLLSISLLTACGGGGGSAPVPVGGGSKPAAGSASMSFFVPASSSVSASGKRHANALPATTQSVEVLVTSSTGASVGVTPAVFNVSATAPGCSSVTGGISCTENITVPTGSLTFVVVAYAGTNATGAAIAEGTTQATITATTSNVTVTMVTESIYAGVNLGGGLGLITLTSTAFSVTSPSNGSVISGSVAALPNGDLRLVVTGSSDPSTPLGTVNYARELPGSVLVFASTGLTAPNVPPSGVVSSGADMGAAVALQGCPATASSPGVTAADIGGPAWSNTPTTSPAYVAGTANITVASGVATVAFSGNDYSSTGVIGQAQTGSQTCSSGIYSATNQGSVAMSPDGFLVVSNGSGNVQPTDVKEGSLGIVQSGAAGSVNTTAVAAATYDGFLGSMSVVSGSVVKSEEPVQVTPVSSNTMQACNYSAFETQTTASVSPSTCATITLGAQTAQEGVVLVSVMLPGASTPTQGAVVVGQTSAGKYVIFGNIGGGTLALLQH